MEYEALVDAVISVYDCVPVLSQTSYRCMSMDSTIRFDDDLIHANLSSVNICFYEDLMEERPNDWLV